MKRLHLNKKQKDSSLVMTRDMKAFHSHLDNQIIVSEEKNKKLKPLEKGIRYNFKERMPPNDFSLKVEIHSSTFGSRVLPSAVVLQHYITMKHMKIPPLYPTWSLVEETKKESFKCPDRKRLTLTRIR